MKFLILCEGDAETRDSWSGISLSVVTHLRAAGHSVQGGDVDLYGLRRWLGALATFSADRERWRSRFHLGAPTFALRTARAAREIRRCAGEIDAILQFGATFAPRGRGPLPLMLYCDSNIAMAEHSRSTGLTYASPLSETALRAVKKREREVYRDAQLIFTISERLRRSFVEDFGVAPQDVRTVHAGPNLDLALIPRSTPVREESAPPTILFVGRQFERKGGDILLEAFRVLRGRIPMVRLIVAGPNEPIVGEGIDWRGNLDPDDAVQRDELLSLYQTADVFCLPTRFEPFGVAFLEAMHFALPCVGTAVDAVPEIISDGETGYTVTVDDPIALADRLSRLLSDRALAHQMGLAGRERARTHFTWSAVVGRMLEAINERLQ